MQNKEIVIFMPSIESGGVEKNLFIISNYLCENFKNVSIITADKNKIISKNKKILVYGPSSNFLIPKNRIFKIIISMIYLLCKILFSKKFLILSFQSNIFAIIVSIIFNFKIIIRANSSPTIWAKNKFKKNIFTIFFRKADAIIVNSYDLQKEFRKKFKLKSYCIYNPLDRQKILLNSKKKNYESFFDNCKNVLKIVNIGRLTDQKNQIIILKALANLKDKLSFRFIIMGSGNLKKNLQNYIDQKNLNENIKIINFKKNPFPLLKSADLFILSSKYEGLPNVLLEALVLKKPIISSNCPTGPREILEGGKYGLLFKNDNKSDLQNKIIEFSNNKKKYYKKVLKSQKSLNKFKYSTNLSKYKFLITKLI